MAVNTQTEKGWQREKAVPENQKGMVWEGAYIDGTWLVTASSTPPQCLGPSEAPGHELSSCVASGHIFTVGGPIWGSSE